MSEDGRCGTCGTISNLSPRHTHTDYDIMLNAARADAVMTYIQHKAALVGGPHEGSSVAHARAYIAAQGWLVE